MVTWWLVPGLVPVRVEFQLPVTLVVSAKFSVTVQVVGVVVPLLWILTSIWYVDVPLLVITGVQVIPPLEPPLLEEDELLEDEAPLLEEDELLEELELLLEEELLEVPPCGSRRKR